MRSPKAGPSIDLQVRDIEVLRSLFESRVMTTAHIGSLHFNGRMEMTKKRLQRLTAAKLIRQRRRKLFEESRHLLANRGIQVLRDRGIHLEYPRLELPQLEKRALVSDSTLQHELEVMDLKTSVHRATGSPNFSLIEFTTWPLLNQFVCYDGRWQTVTVKPDGFFRLSLKSPELEAQEYSFFVELDRSTEAQSKLVTRARHYMEHYRSGKLHQHDNRTHRISGNRPFRVLYVFKTEERRNNTAERLLQIVPPILTHVWLTTFKEVTNDPFGPIWIRPIDYRDRLVGTPFDPSHCSPQPGYKRRTPRDSFVENNVPKCVLLSADGGPSPTQVSL